MLNGQQATINGDGLQTRDYVFVIDVVNANVKALDYNKNDYFNIATGIETNVNELFHHLNHLTNANAKEVHGPAQPGEQLRSVLNIQKAKKLLNWTPQVSINDGLAQTIDFFKQYYKVK